MSNFIIKSFTVGPFTTNMYLIVKDNQGIIIDPGFNQNDQGVVLNKLQKECKNIPYILLTHGHFDHISGCTTLKELFHSQIYCHRFEAEKLNNPDKNGSIFFGFHVESISADHYVNDNEQIKLMGLDIKIIHTPGHSKGSISILLENKYLFSGDTIMQQAMGRTDLDDGDYDEEMLSIKNKILTLPDDIIIYPGHGPATTIKEEKIYYTSGE